MGSVNAKKSESDVPAEPVKRKRRPPHEIRIRAAKAEAAEFDLALRRGQMIERSAVAEAWSSMTDIIQSHMTSIPERLRRLPAVEAAGDPVLAEAIEREAGDLIAQWIGELNRAMYDDSE